MQATSPVKPVNVLMTGLLHQPFAMKRKARTKKIEATPDKIMRIGAPALVGGGDRSCREGLSGKIVTSALP